MEYEGNEVDAALDLIEARDYAGALKILLPLVEEGNPQAILNLAFLYSCGWGVPLDAPKAAEMYLSVGKLEIRERLISAIAYQNLSTLYMAGPPGFPRDDEKFDEYRRRALELGLPM